MRYPPCIENEFPFPPFYRVRTRFSDQQITDPDAALHQTLDRVLPAGIRPGDRVAIGVGSRGITHLPRMVRILCDRVRQMNARPVVIPAMGSHGGATPEGQEKVLASLGVTPETVGAPVSPALDVEKIGTAFGAVPVWCSREALRAGHTVVINRVKPHTKFKADVESGLFKMLTVGLGKHEGALAYHRWALQYGFAELLKAMGRVIIEKTNYRFGIAIVENAFDQPVHIEAVPAGKTGEREPELLRMAEEHFPRLPVRAADVLVVGRIGKEISGAGMDPNVTGRAYDLMESDFSAIFQATRVAILRLSEKSGGNAIGAGYADIITERVFRRMDYETTLMNALTSMSLRKAFIPVRLPSDEKAVQACFTTLGPVPPASVRAILIRDTRHVAEFWASQALKPALAETGRVDILEPVPLRFDAAGNLIQPHISETDKRL